MLFRVGVVWWKNSDNEEIKSRHPRKHVNCLLRVTTLTQKARNGEALIHKERIAVELKAPTMASREKRRIFKLLKG